MRLAWTASSNCSWLMACSLARGVIAFDIQFRLAEQGLVLRQFGRGLIQRRLKGAGINLEKQVALLDFAALDVILLDQVAGDLGADLGVGIAIEGADPLLENGHIARRDGQDLDLGRRRSGRGLLTARRAA